MKVGDVVTVSCATPREKFWGVLLALQAAGVTVRGVSIEFFEDWLRQQTGQAAAVLGPATVFFPSHRIERIELDESSGMVEGLADRFRRVCGREAREDLLGNVIPAEFDGP